MKFNQQTTSGLSIFDVLHVLQVKRYILAQWTVVEILSHIIMLLF